MWDYFLTKSQKGKAKIHYEGEFCIDGIEKDLSFYVGDAAGRTEDFSDSDL